MYCLQDNELKVLPKIAPVQSSQTLVQCLKQSQHSSAWNAFFLKTAKTVIFHSEVIEYLKSLVGTANHALTSTPKGSPASTSHLEDQTVRILDLEREIGQDEKDLATARTEIAAAISGLNNENLITILQMRYLDYMCWEDIMASMDYCRSNLYELHGRALRMRRQRQSCS